MSFTVINRFAMAHLRSHLAVVYHHDSPLPATSPHQLSHRTRRSEAEPRWLVRPPDVPLVIAEYLDEQTLAHQALALKVRLGATGERRRLLGS